MPSDLKVDITIAGIGASFCKESSGRYKVDRNFLSKLKDGHVVVQGGGFKKPMRENSEKVERLLSLAEKKASIFKSLTGLDLWLSHGNLLGLTREGGFLPHEKDVDMSYVSLQPTLSSFKEEYEFIIKTLVSEGQKISLWRPDGSLRKFLQWHDESDPRLLIDVFPSWYDAKKGRLIGQTMVYCDFSPEDFFPLIEKELHGKKFFIPRAPQKYLLGTYGKNWDKVDNLHLGRKRQLEPAVKSALKSILPSDDSLIKLHPVSNDAELNKPKYHPKYAFKNLKNEISLGDDSADVLYKVAKLFEKDGSLELAAGILDKIVTVWPSDMFYKAERKRVRLKMEAKPCQ